MTDIPEEVRCFADPEKACPLRAAVHSANQAGDASGAEQSGSHDLSAALESAAATLSKSDLVRFHAMVDTDSPTQDIRPGTCQGGYRGIPLLGKLTCGAATIHYIYKNAL